MRQMRWARGPSAAIAAVTALAALAWTIAGCGDANSGGDTAASKPAATTSFVGKLAHSRAFVALVVHGDTVRAYVCDGKHLGHWFNGRLADHSVAAGAATGTRLKARVDSGAATGSVTLAKGRPLAFKAVAAHGNAGLYRGAGHGYTGGWIVLADGAQRGVVATKTTTFAAPLLTSKAIVDGRIAITPIPIPGSVQVPIPIKVAPGGGLGV